MSIIKTFVTATVILITSGILSAEESKKEPVAEPKMASPKGAKVYIIFPKDGKTVKPKFLVRFGLKKNGRCSRRNKISQPRSPSSNYRWTKV